MKACQGTVKLTFKRIFSLFLAVCIASTVISAFPVYVAAATSGTCGDSLKWTLDGEGTLTVSGTGAMYNWEYYGEVPWASQRNGIKSVKIGDNVTTIGDYAFSDCYSLTSVTIGNSVTAIGDSAFFYCNSLTSVTIGDSVTTIGENAFSDCDSLISITISDSVTTIGDLVFCDCDSLTSIEVDNNNPSYASVDGNLFNKSKTELIQYAIGKTASSYTIPDSVTTIGDHAFSYCDSLISITIPNSVTTIGDYAFYSCDSLTSIEVDNNNPSYASVDGNLFNKSKTELIQYAIGKTDSSYSIPDSVTTIGDFVFCDCDSLISITIPDSVTTIGVYAFCSCDSLISITIPNSVTIIGEGAFEYCYSLTSITIPDSVTTIGAITFFDCNSLTSVTIPDSVTTIGDFVFYDCDSLTSITIPDSVTTIGDYAFVFCDSLTDVYYTGTEEDWKKISIGSGNENLTNANIHHINVIANGTCGDSLKWTLDDEGTLTISGTGAMYNWGYYGEVPWNSQRNGIKSVKIGDSVTTIGMYAFYNCDSLTSVTIPDSVTTIGDYAFYYCDSLTDVYYTGTEEDWKKISIGSNNSCLINANIHYGNIIASGTCGDSLKWTLDDEGTLTISGNGAMYDWTNSSQVPWYSQRNVIKCVKIGDNVTTIGDFAFYSCDSLTSVTIPDSVTTIGMYAFYNCNSLTSIIIPDSVTAIGYRVFCDCDNLTSVTIPDSVTTIGIYAFCNCDNLTSITIPDSVTTIGDCAFYYCDSLTSITIPDSVTTIGNYAFESCGSLTDVYYIGSEEDWKKISIGSENEILTNAVIHYIYTVYPNIIFEVECQRADGVISVDVTLSRLEEAGTLYMAVYDAEGSLYSLAEVPVTPDSMEYTLSAEAAEGEQRVKLLCIDANVMKPLSKTCDCDVTDFEFEFE